MRRARLFPTRRARAPVMNYAVRGCSPRKPWSGRVAARGYRGGELAECGVGGWVGRVTCGYYLRSCTHRYAIRALRELARHPWFALRCGPQISLLVKPQVYNPLREYPQARFRDFSNQW